MRQCVWSAKQCSKLSLGQNKHGQNITTPLYVPSSLKPRKCVPVVVQSLNVVLISKNPEDLPLTDLAKASSLPYDTDIPQGPSFMVA